MFRSSGLVVLIFSFILTACDSTNTPAFIGGSPSSVTVLPADTQVVAGVTWQYFAVATFPDGSQSDITDSSEWSVADESVATVDSQTGLLTTLAAGTTNRGIHRHQERSHRRAAQTRRSRASDLSQGKRAGIHRA